MFSARAESQPLLKTAAVVVNLILCLVPSRLLAATVYTNISGAFPGNTVSPGNPRYGQRFDSGTPGGVNAFAGTRFTTTGGGRLTSVVTVLYQTYSNGQALVNGLTASPPATVGLYTDSSGQPGVLLESWSVPTVPSCVTFSSPGCFFNGVVPPLTTFSSVLQPLLSSGTKYWLVVKSGTGDETSWWQNDQGVIGGLWTDTTIDPLYQASAASPTPGIQVNADPTQLPVRTGVLSHIAAGGGWSTVITLINTLSAAVPVTVTLHNDDGSALTLPVTTTQQGASQTTATSSVNATINPNTTLLISMGNQNAPLVWGWADVDSTGPVGGFAIFRSTPPTGSPSEGTVPLQTQFSSSFTLPYDNTAGFAMGVALANLSTSSANITATIWDVNGNKLGTENFTVAGSGHTAFTLPSQWALTAGQQGIVQFQSAASGGITGIGLRFSPFGTFTSVPTM